MNAPQLADLETFLPAFGLSAFRRGQREVIETVLAGQDCLCVMPTGGGKSLCYQLPAIATGGLTLVISPLIALMKDQVDSLHARGLSATFINSTLSPDEIGQRLDQMIAGEYRLVYAVPERFRSPRFVEALRRSDLRLLAIDEAHCVSEWGHDFRPDYAKLGRFRQQLGQPPTIALTATATDAVRSDIVALLELREPKTFITGFARPNLSYSVQSCPTDYDKDSALFEFLAANPGSGIVYASTRKRCEELAERITSHTRRLTSIYHAGLAPDQRRAAQDDFMQGRTQIAVATLAFGMGIDKSDIRFVVHYNLPGSIEAYYQEAGRAGRDGQPASCLLLFGGADRKIHEFFIESAYPSREVVKQVYEFLCEQRGDTVELTQQEIKEQLELQITGEGIGACEKLLEKAGVIERLEAAENTAAVRLNSDLPTLVDLLPPQAKVKRQVLRAVERMVGMQRHDWCYFQPRALLMELPDFDSGALSRNLRELASLSSFDYVPPFRGRAIHVARRGVRFDQLDIDFDTLEKRKAAEYERIDHVLRFARGHRCRQQIILHYFGENTSATCGNCDNCQGEAGERRSGDARAVTPQALETVRIVLSGVARVNQRRAGAGKQLLAQMLCGSAAQAVVRNRLDKLSTFGLLSKFKQPEVSQVIDSLLLAGLLEQTEIEPFRPVIRLTQAGVDVMAGRDTDPARLTLPDSLWKKLDRGAAAPAAALDEDGVDGELVAALRQWRDDKCSELKLPHYMILGNATIAELAERRPSTLDQLVEVKGIGPAKVEQYGEELLALISAHSGTTEDSPPATAATPDSTLPDEPASIVPDEATHEPRAPIATSAPPAGGQPSHYWTWRLLAAGLSPDECAQARDLAPEVVFDHALRAADAGWQVDPRWFLADELIAEIERVVGPGVPQRIRRLLDQLPRGTRYEEVQLVVKARQQATSEDAAPS